MKLTYPLDFLKFYAQYPRKVAKVAALKAWTKVTASVAPETILSHLEHCKKEWDDPKFIPHASTWLRRESFDEEFEAQEDDKEPLFVTETLHVRADILHRVRQHEQRQWDEDAARHRHSISCGSGLYCRFAEVKRPVVSTIDELMERMK